MNTKPILYLDVDGVLISFREDRTRLHYEMHRGGFPAQRVGQFIDWVDRNFEVRWLTAWAINGSMKEESRLRLSAILWHDIPESWVNPLPWWNNKVEGIDFKEVRPWFWMDDEQSEADNEMVPRDGPNFIHTNSSKDEFALVKSSITLYTRVHRLSGISTVEYPIFVAGAD